MAEDIVLVNEKTGEKIIYIEFINNEALEQLARILHADIVDAEQFRK